MDRISYTKRVLKQDFIAKFSVLKPQNNWFFLGLLFLLTLIPLLYGFSRFPKFLGDEGIYVSQAWWLVNFHKLGPYTYWYDHFPLGWLIIGLWQRLTGGPFVFGFSLISGRLLMVLLAGISNVFLFKLIYKLTKSLGVAVLGAVLFMFSPLSVLFHRQVLLDNIASFWLILGLYTFFSGTRKGRNIFWGSIFLSLAILSKESVLFVLPVFWGVVYWLNKGKNRHYLFLISFLTMGFFLSLFPLLALLKGELLPGIGHVSFLETLALQAQRGTQIPFWQPESDFLERLLVWLRIDPFLIFFGLGSLGLNFLFGAKDKIYLSLGLMTLFFLFFLLRGGLVLDFYIIPLIPLLIIQACLLMAIIAKEIKVRLSPGLMPLVLLVLAGLLLWQGKMLYVVDATANQLRAVERLRAINDKKAVIVADNFAFLDLRLDKDSNVVFRNIDWYSKAESDPEIREGKLADNPQKIDYLLVNSTMGREIETGSLEFLQKAKENLALTEEFPPILSGEFNYLLKDLGYMVEELSLYTRVSFEEEATEEMISQPNLEQKLSYLLMMVPGGTKLSDEEEQEIKEGKLRNLFLLDKNIASPVQIGALTEITEGGKEELLIAVDQEGGRVSRIPWIDGKSQTEIENEEQAYTVARERGEALKKVGINMNFAPVLDVPGLSWASFVGRQGRFFEGDVGDVGKLGAAMIKGYLDAGILPTAKHFPGGLGRTSKDPHLTLPVIFISQEELNRDLEPYKKAIAAQVPAIMVTHILYPEVDQKPTSASKIFIKDILRNQLGFAGLVVVDDLSMGAVKNNYQVGEYAVESILAGADLLLVTSSDDYQEIVVSLKQAVEEEKLPEERINLSLERRFSLRKLVQ